MKRKDTSLSSTSDVKAAATPTATGAPNGKRRRKSSGVTTALALNERLDEARALFERLLGLTNDLGLLSEEYDVARQRQVGNFPQAFSHLALVNAAATITGATRAQPA
jgi:Glycosyl hydrolases family 15